MYAVKERLCNLLPWLGALLLLLGLCITPLYRQLPSGRLKELVVLCLLAGAVAWLLKRTRSIPMASGLALFWVLLLPIFTGPLPWLASAFLALAGIAIGQMLFPRRPLALQAIVGMVAMAGVMGWTLLLPIHSRWLYLAAAVALVAWRRSTLWALLRVSRTHWRRAVEAAPRSATLAMFAMGLASTACWLPTLQYDDLTYHLRLPWQLMENGVYFPAPQYQIWALAPWATDILQAIPQVITGTESRGAVNAIWLVLLATGAWQFAAALDAGPQLRWLAIALIASLPMTANLAAGMQVELPSAAVVLWLCALAAAPADGRLSNWMLMAVLAGGLLAMKSMSGLQALPVLIWALYRHPWPSWPSIGQVLLIGLLIGGSSYVFATWIAGNPVLPLFNSVFHSPYFGAEDFVDLRYKTGFGPGLPWNLTFHSSRYHEGFDGAAGVILIGLAGLWLLALLRPSTRAAAVVTLAVLTLPLMLVQYLRYAYPGMVMLCVLAPAALGAGPVRRSLVGLLVAVCVLNLGYQSSANWMLRGGALKQTLKAPGGDVPMFQRFVPERSLASAIRRSGEARGNVLLLDPSDAFFAEFGTRGRTISWYAPGLLSAAAAAELDPTGQRWLALLQKEQVRHVILRVETTTPVQRAALELAGARLREEAGDRQWWSLPPLRERHP
ncbi:hypothetical protein [Stenotrophomonas sp. ATs4]|uniref:hypothetical protein n=1 Tax=Stenotrophomonas sp. ATs4 TaxID=3402766 RepID=UPI003F725D9C